MQPPALSHFLRSPLTPPFRPLLRWLLVLLLAPAVAYSAPLPPAVGNALREAGIAPQDVAIVVRGVDAGAPLLSHNARQAMNPASTMKLVTTYAGLELLGPAYRWKTEALSETPPVAGRLAGNLYLRGSGAPKLTLEQFWLLLRQLRARGVAEIDGDLVLDRSAFAVPAHDPAAFDNAPLRPYNAGPDALLVNLKSVHLTLQADAQRNAVAVIAETPGAGLRIDNRLMLSEDGCGDWREKLQTTVDGGTIELRGSFPAACGEKALHLAPWPADEQVDRLFRALWNELGGTLRGTVRAGLAPAAARVVARTRLSLDLELPHQDDLYR